VPLGGACIDKHAKENLYEKMKISVVEKFLSNQAAGAGRVGIPQIELSEDEVGVAL
jgi:hypothetical protein